ncbi:MAG TPA: ECF-type sigma factor [Isosphaeraceae bacterium]|nr:ECF-type sigma factor [Isosphaeraceae bacterium]
MSNDDPVTLWLDGIKAGDNLDIDRLWNRYFQRLVRLAGARLPAHCRRAFDEEDVALSAFQSFCDRAGRGQFPRLNDRDDLWRVLATITVRKALDTMRHQVRQKRGGGRVLGESALLVNQGGEGEGLAEILGREPTPEAAARFADGYRSLLAKLHDPTLRSIAERRLEGQTTQEIAAAHKVSTKTIERKLHLIRAIWSQEDPQ